MGGGGNRSHKFTRQNLKPYTICFLSILCIHWGIASYQPFIDTALILLCGGIIAIIIDNNGDLKTSLYKSRFLIISVALATISYKIIFDIIKKIGIATNEYNNQIITLSSLPERIVLAIKVGFSSLFTYDVAFMPLSMTILFAIFLVSFLFFLFVSKLQISKKLSIFTLLCGAIVASQTHIVLSANIEIIPRIEYYGLMFLRVLFVALTFKICVDSIHNHKLAKNLLFILSIILIWICVVQDLYAQRVKKLTFDYELKLLNRVIDRIESNENFSYEKRYCGIMFGEIKVALTKYYRYTNKYKDDRNELKGMTLLPSFALNTPFHHFTQEDIFADCAMLSSHFQYPHQKKLFYSLVTRLHKAGILDKLQPFPHKNSVVVFEDIIVFVASQGDLDEIKQMAKDLP